MKRSFFVRPEPPPEPVPFLRVQVVDGEVFVQAHLADREALHLLVKALELNALLLPARVPPEPPPAASENDPERSVE